MTSMASKSLKMNFAKHFAFTSDGVVFLDGSANQKMGWGLNRLELATQKVTEIGSTSASRISGPYAALADTVVGVETGDDLRTVSIVALDQQTGEVRTRFGAKADRWVIAVAASADLQFVGVLSADRTVQKPSLEVFDASSGKSVLKVAEATAFAFSAETVVVIAGATLVHHPLGKGKPKTLPFKGSVAKGAMQRRGQLLLSGGTVIDETNGKVVLELNQHRVTWGAAEDTLVSSRLDGLVEIVNLKGKVIKQFFRPRKNDADSFAMSPSGWWLASTGSFLEMYDLSDGKKLATTAPAPRAAPVKRPAPTSTSSEDPKAAKLFEKYWQNPDDSNSLSVWADLLAEHGDVRAEFVQLSLLPDPTDAQIERRAAIEKKEAGRLVGPARPYLRNWLFGHTGLVESATCEADQLIAGFDAIVALHPRLSLVVTSLRKKTLPTIAQLIKLPLARIWYLRLEANGLTDKALAALAPGLQGVKHLSLDGNDVTGDGLTALAAHAAELEFLALGFSSAQREQRREVLAGWVDALTVKGAFPKLRALHFRGGYGGVALDAEQLRRLTAKPGMKLVKTSDGPAHGASVVGWKQGRLSQSG